MGFTEFVVSVTQLCSAAGFIFFLLPHSSFLARFLFSNLNFEYFFIWLLSSDASEPLELKSANVFISASNQQHPHAIIQQDKHTRQVMGLVKLLVTSLKFTKATGMIFQNTVIHNPNRFLYTFRVNDRCQNG